MQMNEKKPLKSNQKVIFCTVLSKKKTLVF